MLVVDSWNLPKGTAHEMLHLGMSVSLDDCTVETEERFRSIKQDCRLFGGDGSVQHLVYCRQVLVEHSQTIFEVLGHLKTF